MATNKQSFSSNKQSFSLNKLSPHALIGFVFILLLIPVTVVAITRFSGTFETRSRAAYATTKIYIWPTTANLTTNQELQVEIRLDSAQTLSNMDLVLSFNPSVVEVMGNIVPGRTFSQYAARLVDNQKGLVGIGGRGEFLGNGVFASFKLQTKVKGDVNLHFNYLNAGGVTLDAQTADYKVQ